MEQQQVQACQSVRNVYNLQIYSLTPGHRLHTFTLLFIAEEALNHNSLWQTAPLGVRNDSGDLLLLPKCIMTVEET